ncbi:MAG: hypothetical protein ACI8SE_000207 [Bacteroidia bacterium]
MKNIKSFKYRFNSNYNRIEKFINQTETISFIETGIVYEVEVLGHSCGISDRVLLKELFEHKSCKSIKIHYNDKHCTSEESFIDTFINISRHFKNKISMKHKIRMIENCQRIPQHDDVDD